MDERKLHHLLDMQEHPERYTDEELAEMLSDHEAEALLESAALLKRALMCGQHTARQHSQRRWLGVAASMIGILFVSGIAFAAIHHFAHTGQQMAGGAVETPAQEVRISSPRQPTADTDSVAMKPKVFDNVTMDEMLPEIATYYGLSVQFQNEQVRRLRFYFKWNPAAPVSKVVEELNMFERVNLRLNDKTIIAE